MLFLSMHLRRLAGVICRCWLMPLNGIYDLLVAAIRVCFAASLVVCHGGSLAVRARAEDTLAKRAAWMESNATRVDGTLLTEFVRLKGGQEEVWSTESTSCRGDDCLKRVFPGAPDEDALEIVMLNPMYCASIARTAADSEWRITDLRLSGEAGYKSALDSLRSAHPSIEYLRAGLAWLPAELQVAEVVEGPEVTESGVRYVVNGQQINFFTRQPLSNVPRELYFDHDRPNRLLSYRLLNSDSDSTQKVSLDGWVEVQGLEFPQRLYVDVISQSSLKRERVLEKRWLYNDEVGFRDEELFLSHYGLPEPRLKTGSARMLYIAVACCALLVLFIWLKRRETPSG